MSAQFEQTLLITTSAATERPVIVIGTGPVGIHVVKLSCSAIQSGP